MPGVTEMSGVAVIRQKNTRIKRVFNGFLLKPVFIRLLDLGFFIHDVLPDFRVELANLDFLRMQPFVLGGCVVVARACRRNQFDFIAHFLCS